MADSTRKVFRLGGPWKGLNENPGEATEQQCEECWNMDFDGEFATTRGGRRIIGEMTYGAVSKVLWEDIPAEGSTSWKVISGLDQGVSSANTEYDMTGWAATDYMYVGFPFKFNSFYVYMNTVNTVTSAMTAAFHNGSGWQTLTVTDGTKKFKLDLEYASLGQSGTVSYSAPTAWVPVSIQGSDPLYWVRLKWDYAPTVGHIGYINCTVSSAGSALPINGLYHWQRYNGERLLIVGADDTTNKQARLFEYNRTLGTSRPLTIRGVTGDTSSGIDAEWRFAVLGNILIACNGYCFLHSTAEDPRVMVPMERVEVRESADLKPFAPADAKFVAVHGGRIYYVSRSKPNFVFFSQPVDGPIKNEIVGAAPLVGAGIFDPEFSFYVADSSGGNITGLVPQKDKLLVFTPRSTQAWFINGDNVLASALQTLDNEVGCVAPGTLAPTNSGVFFLGPGSVYVNSNGVNQDIGRRVSKTIKDLNSLALFGARSSVYLKKRQYRLYVPAGINSQNDTALVFNWEADTWAKYGMPRWISQSTTPYSGAYFVSYATSLRDAEWDEELVEADYFGRLLWADVGKRDTVVVSATNTDAPIYWQLNSHRLKFQDGSVFRVRSVRSFSESVGSTYFTVGIVRDGRKTYSRNGTSSLIEIGEEHIPAYQYDDVAYGEDVTKCYIAGSATTGLTLGTGTWVSKRIRPTDVAFGMEAFYFQVVINARNSSATHFESLKLGAVEAEAVITPGRR